MATTSDIRKGLCIKYNHDIYKIIEFLHVKPGKGPAFVRTKLKSVTTGKVIDNTFSAGHKIDDIRVETHKFQYLYNEGETYHFMNTEDYNQIQLQESNLDRPDLIKEGEVVTVVINSDQVILFEATSGPFDPEDTYYADWSPQEGQAEEIATLRQELVEFKLRNRKKKKGIIRNRS